MIKSTISTFELFAMFPDEPTAREYLERLRWPGGTQGNRRILSCLSVLAMQPQHMGTG